MLSLHDMARSGEGDETKSGGDSSDVAGAPTRWYLSLRGIPRPCCRIRYTTDGSEDGVSNHAYIDLIDHKVVHVDPCLDPVLFPAALELQTLADSIDAPATWHLRNVLVWTTGKGHYSLDTKIVPTKLTELSDLDDVPRAPRTAPNAFPVVQASAVLPGSTWLLWWIQEGVAGYHLVHISAISTKFVAFTYNRYHVVLEKVVFLRFCAPKPADDEMIKPGVMMHYMEKCGQKPWLSVMVLREETDGGVVVVCPRLNTIVVQRSSLSFPPKDDGAYRVNHSLQERMSSLRE